MAAPSSLCLVVLLLAASSLLLTARAEDPYRFYTWNVTFGDIFPLGVKQQVRAPTVRARALRSSVLSRSDFEPHFRRRYGAGDPDQRPVPGAADRRRHQRQHRHQRLQQPPRPVPPLLVNSALSMHRTVHVCLSLSWLSVPSSARMLIHAGVLQAGRQLISEAVFAHAMDLSFVGVSA